MQHNLDLLVLHSENGNGGYKMANGKVYEAYMCNELWNNFLQEMKTKYTTAYNAYVDGMGNELKEMQYPPKMASYGSSSRFIYLLSRDIPGFEFEIKKDTKIGGKASLDGYCRRGNKDIYVEAKRREIYPKHSFCVKDCYIEVYKYLNRNSKFDYKLGKGKEEKTSNISFYYDEKEILYFDIKQIICHFLGIINNLPDNYSNSIEFIYLIYNPEKLEPCSNVSDRQLNNLKNRYKKAIEQTQFFDFKEMFSLIYEYLKKDKEMPEFTFKLVDQEHYKEEFGMDN